MPKDLKQRKCLVCKKPFLAKKVWQKFCSDICKREYHRNRKCPKCGYTYRIGKEKNGK